MVAADEGQREGQVFQPVQRFIVAAVAQPHAPEVSGDDDCVIFRHGSLFREVFLLEPVSYTHLRRFWMTSAASFARATQFRPP